MCGRGAVCVLMAVISGLALVRSPKESEGVPGVTDGGTLSDSDGDPPPWVMEDTDHLEVEGLQLSDNYIVESNPGTVGNGNGHPSPSVSDLDNSSIEMVVDTELNTKETPVIDDHKLSDGGGSTARPAEQEASSPVEELESLSEGVQKDSSVVSDSAIAEGELGEDQHHKEGEDIESPEQVEGVEMSDVASPEEKATNYSDAQGTQGMEEREPPLQEEHQPQEEEEEGKEGEKEEEEGDLTFEEFKQRKMMEQEAAQQVADSIASIPISKAKNNYASVDCGAKVIDTNPEARNPTAILIENRDVYMLNPCSADIWFVVELCDMVSVQTLEIACLELFSSVPESFNVYSAERYPDPEWVHLGKFQAANERKVQSFPLASDQHVYAKYIKVQEAILQLYISLKPLLHTSTNVHPTSRYTNVQVEMVSHFGREHYCPISLLRVLGASMMEVFQYSEERKEQHGQQQPAVVLPPSEGFSEDDSLGEVENERLRQNGALLAAAKDAVLNLLEQPLNLLGKVNGFLKPEERDGERTGRGCKEEEGVEGCLIKEAAVTGDEMGEQKGGTPGRTVEGDKTLENSDHDIPDQNPGERREESVSEQYRHTPSERIPEAAANGSEGHGEGGGQSPPRPEETPSADPDTAPASTVDPSGVDYHLGPSDPHSLKTEQELKETPINSKTTSNESSAQNSTDVEKDDSTVQPQEEGFQDGGELKDTTVDDSDLKRGDEHAFVQEPLETGPDVLAEGEEFGAGDGEWGLALDVVGNEDVGFDEAGVKTALRQDGAKNDEIDGTLVAHGGEATMGMKDGSPLQPLGPEVVNLGDTARGNGDEEVGVPQGDLPGIGIDTDLGPTMAPEEDAVLQNGEHTVRGIQEVDSVAIQEVELHEHSDKLEVRSDTATAVLDGESMSQEPSEIDVNNCSRTLEARGNASMDKNGSNDSSLANVSEMEDPDSHGNEGMTAEQLSVLKLDEDGHHLGSPADRNGSGDASLDQQNVTGGSISNGLPAKSSNETLLPPTNGSNIPAGHPKEKSVFVRLSNRIRDLEVNMSLFSSYLDQLSSSLKRNKNRTEDTQKSLDKRISALNESLQSLKQEAELSTAGLRGVSSDLCQVTAAMQEMAAGLHSIKEEITSQYLFVGLIQMIVVTFQLLAMCLCLACKQRSLGNELQNLRSVARIPTQNHVTLPQNHLTKNHTHESQCSCYVAEPQPSNHNWGSVPGSGRLGSSDYYNCKDRRKGLATPSQSSLEGSDWDSEPWQLATKRRKKKGKSSTS